MKQHPEAGEIVGGVREVHLTELAPLEINGHQATKPITVDGVVVFDGCGPTGDFVFWRTADGLAVSHPSWDRDLDVTAEYPTPTIAKGPKGEAVLIWDREPELPDYVQPDLASIRVMRPRKVPRFEQ